MNVTRPMYQLEAGGMNTAAAYFQSTCPHTLFPTIDHSYLNNDGYYEEDSFLDIDYQEADYGNDLDLASPSCEKSGQHEEFINMDDFSLDKLPTCIQVPSVVVWLKYSAQLVVRLSYRANATGRVFVMNPNINKQYRCKNPRCPYNSLFGSDHIVHGGLAIITNRHVVKSHDEARESKVEFFYHNSDRRDMVVTEKGHLLHSTNPNFDYSILTCNMHQPQLLDRITICTNVAGYAWRCIPEATRRELKYFAIIISHPHGTSKKISIGKVIGHEPRNHSRDSVRDMKRLRDLYNICEKSKNALRRFDIYFSLIKDISLRVRVTYYDAATCPGSSGAPVYMANTYMEGGVEVNPPHTHRGKHPVNSYNNCYT